MRHPWTRRTRLSRPRAVIANWLALFILLLSSAALQADNLARELRDLLSPLIPFDGDAFTHQVSAADVARFYVAREFRPAWQDGERLQRLHQAVGDLEGDGLDPTRYSVPDTDPDAWRLCDELAATTSYLQALLHLHFGALDRATIEPLWRHREIDRRPRRSFLLGQADRHLDTPADAFKGARPQVLAYPVLRRAYLDLLADSMEQPPWPQVSSGPLLRQGAIDPRVDELRRRLASGGYFPVAGGYADATASEEIELEPKGGEGIDGETDKHHYDETLHRAVLAFQRAHFLAEDGVIGPATLVELNKSRGARLDQLRANLERLRWRAAELEPHMVVVDIAGAHLQYYQDGALRWQARTQVGTAARRTPDLKSAITHFTFNPSWTIPPTILRQDKLPQIRSNPDYLAENRIQVLDSDGNPLDPSLIDWDRPGAIMLRQPPGPHNPLGQVAIRFPNPFAVYLHDTPSQRLFGSAQRTFSSGCVRVEGAMSLVDQLIATASDYSQAYIDRVIDSGRTGNIRLSSPVPLLMDYWTADVDDWGRLTLRPDIYRRDNDLATALRRTPPSRALPVCHAP